MEIAEGLALIAKSRATIEKMMAEIKAEKEAGSEISDQDAIAKAAVVIEILRKAVEATGYGSKRQ